MGPEAPFGCHAILTTLSKSNPADKSAVEEFTLTVIQCVSGPCCSMPKPKWVNRNAYAVVNVILSTCTCATVVRKPIL